MGKVKIEKNIPLRMAKAILEHSSEPLSSHFHCKRCSLEMKYLIRLSWELAGVSDLYYCKNCHIFLREYETGSLSWFNQNE